uniref:hypothetical protein n=1 Tax=Pseudomonas viridiflava TaxID=33069 RepID=UPI0019818676
MTAVGKVATAPLLVFERSFGREAFAIRAYPTRSGVPFQTILIETDEDCRHQLGAALTETSLPVVVFPYGTRLADPTPAQIAE